MPNSAPPLTDQQIRIALENQIARTMHLHLDLLVLQKALLKAGILREADIEQARQEVKHEGKEAFAKLGDAIRRGPAGEIQ